MANASSAVSTGDVIEAAHMNNVRSDAIGPYGAERVWPDDIAAKFGTGEDVSITFNGTNLQVALAAPASFLWGDTSNAFMTQGATWNQGAADNEIQAYKSSDVDHGMTTLTETDTYFTAGKAVAAEGGVALMGYSENIRAFQINARYVSDTVTKTTAGLGAFGIVVQKKSGTTVGDPGADANLFYLAANGTTRFIWDAEGSGHADVEWTTYDTYDDLAVIDAMEEELLSREDESQTARRVLLEQTGVINRNSWHMENGRPRAMVNMTKLAMLHHGALRQVHARMQALESKLAALPQGAN